MVNDGRLLRVKLAYERNFTQIPNDWVRDPKLSLRARGLLALLMSHDDGYTVTFRTLARQNREGDAAIRTAVGELRAAGYLEVRRERGRHGQIVGSIWELTDPAEMAKRRSQGLLDIPGLDQPHVDNPHLAKPRVGNQRLKEAQEEEHLTQVIQADPSTRARVTESALDVLAEQCPGLAGRPHNFEVGSVDGWCQFCTQARADGSLYDKHGAMLRGPQVVNA